MYKTFWKLAITIVVEMAPIVSMYVYSSTSRMKCRVKKKKQPRPRETMVQFMCLCVCEILEEIKKYILSFF